MKIAFILNGPSTVPIGGHKVVYEYANAMAQKGHKVTIYFDCEGGRNIYGIPPIVMYFRRWIIGKYKIKWFSLEKQISLCPCREINQQNVGKNDIIVTTAVVPAKKAYENLSKKNKIINLVQGYETWCLPEKDLQWIFKQGKKNIVVAQWLKEKMQEDAREKTIYIPNGIDLNFWRVKNSIEKRDAKSIAMLYSVLETKGSQYGILALEKVKQKYSELHVTFFGTTPRSDNIPEWVHYVENASPEQVFEIYNNAAIYLNPSLGEGFGLTNIESMACGCALITTNYDAVKDYAVHESNAIVTEIKNVEQMVNALEYLIEKNIQRIEIAQAGNEMVNKRFQWEQSFQEFEKVLKEEIET